MFDQKEILKEEIERHLLWGKESKKDCDDKVSQFKENKHVISDKYAPVNMNLIQQKEDM